MIRRQLLIAAVCLSAIGTANAFGLPGLGGGDKKASGGAVSEETLLKNQEKLQKDTFSIMKLLVSSEIDLAAALQAKEKIQELKDIEKSLKSGNVTQEHIEKVSAVSKAMNEIVVQKQKEQVKLDKKRGQALAKASLKYAGAVGATAGVSAAAVKLGKDAGEAVKAAGITGAMSAKKKFGFVLTVTSELPDLVKQIVTTGNSFVDYAKFNGLKVDEAEKKIAKAASM